MKNAVFIDWLTASQHHPEGGLPVITGGLIVFYDERGCVRSERNCATSHAGSFDTSVRVSCDGFRVSLSGNVGRFGRKDNLFNFGWDETREAVNRILVSLGLPIFTVSRLLPSGEKQRGAVVSRLDITANFATGSESQARAAIRGIGSRSISRMKKGTATDESVWYANSRSMLKAYIKHLELANHGTPSDDPSYVFAKENGIVRLECEIKKRVLSELKMNDWDDISQEKLEHLFTEQTAPFRSFDRSDEPDLLDSIPTRSRVYASAWLAGQDLRATCSRATLFRHARVLREHGLDILEPRNLVHFPVKVRIVDLVALEAPDWYWKSAA